MSFSDVLFNADFLQCGRYVCVLPLEECVICGQKSKKSSSLTADSIKSMEQKHRLILIIRRVIETDTSHFCLDLRLEYDLLWGLVI